MSKDWVLFFLTAILIVISKFLLPKLFAFIVVLGILVFVHELGHFLFARLFGVGVETFSLGFGPRVFGKTSGITDYRLSAIPLGGYVKMVGEEPDTEVEPEKIPISFQHKNVWKRMIIVAAGPFFNLLLAVVIFWGMYWVYGESILKPTIGSVEPNSAADEAGLMKGDQVIAIDGVPVDSWSAMAKIIAESQGNPLEISIQRNELFKSITVVPRIRTTQTIFGEETKRFVIGITPSGDSYTVSLSPGKALVEGVIKTWEVSKLTVISVVKIIQGVISPKTLGGPIMIAQMAGEQAKEGASNLIFFIALLSINLGILNILPIPVLDGGHLMFFTIEAIIRRPVNKRAREIAQQAGVVILMLLMIYVFYNDISRFFSS